MKLQEYLDDTGVPVAVFARKVGVSAATIYNILSGERDIRLSVALKIEEVTKNQVTCRELLLNSTKPTSKKIK